MNDALSGLSPYQRAAVRHLEDLYLNRGRSVYLVAGEVGLGKTFIAKALIQRLGARRVIYIASNAEIARANVDELTDRGRSGQTVSADRLSMFRPDALTPPEALWVYPSPPPPPSPTSAPPPDGRTNAPFSAPPSSAVPPCFRTTCAFWRPRKKPAADASPSPANSAKKRRTTPSRRRPPTAGASSSRPPWRWNSPTCGNSSTTWPLPPSSRTS